MYILESSVTVFFPCSATLIDLVCIPEGQDQTTTTAVSLMARRIPRCCAQDSPTWWPRAARASPAAIHHVSV